MKYFVALLIIIFFLVLYFFKNPLLVIYEIDARNKCFAGGSSTFAMPKWEKTYVLKFNERKFIEKALQEGKCVKDPTTGKRLTLSTYFSDKLTKKIGQTYEGYDAQIVIQNFPGVSESDFNGVQTAGGMYEYSNNKLNFKAGNIPQSSTSETIVDYSNLLKNISNRLGIPLNTYQDIDTLLSRISE